MKFKIIEMFLGDFPDLKNQYNELVAKGYQPYKCEINESYMEDTLSVELEVLLKDSVGKRIKISQHKPVNEEENFYIIDKNSDSCISKFLRPKVKLSQQDVLNKEFKKSFMGYNCEEVDNFLDIIIKDYDEYEKILNAE